MMLFRGEAQAGDSGQERGYKGPPGSWPPAQCCPWLTADGQALLTLSNPGPGPRPHQPPGSAHSKQAEVRCALTGLQASQSDSRPPARTPLWPNTRGASSSFTPRAPGGHGSLWY